VPRAAPPRWRPRTPIPLRGAHASRCASSAAQALRLTPENHPERLNLHSNRAAAYLMLRQYADVVAECSLILRAAPAHAKALARRAKAYDATMQYAKALRDLDALAEAGGDAGEDLSGMHERVKALVADPGAAAKPLTAQPLLPPRPSGNGAGREVATAQASAAAQQQAQQQRPSTQWVKCSLGDDTRVVAYATEAGLAGLRHALARKWPEEAVPLVVKPKAAPPPAPDAPAPSPDAPPAPDASVAIASEEALFAALAAWAPSGRLPHLRLVRPGEEGEPPYDNGLLDEWILDFAALFREHLGVDAEAHLDLHAEGLDTCNNAMLDGIPAAAAGPLFDAAAGKFQEAAAFALFNWGNVHMCAARKRMDAGKPPATKTADGVPPPPAPPAPPLPPAAIAEVEALLSAAEARYINALGVKADFYDASIACAQQRYERARLLAGAPGRDAEADALFGEANARFAAVMDVLPDEPAAEPVAAAVIEAPAGDAAEGEAAPEPEASIKAQVLVMWGNVLYEHSAARARAKRSDWQPLLDTAVEKFHAAGCSQADIDAALASHAGKA
jgi:hypothetical protein